MSGSNASEAEEEGEDGDGDWEREVGGRGRVGACDDLSDMTPLTRENCWQREPEELAGAWLCA